MEHDAHFFNDDGTLSDEARFVALQGLPYFLAGNIGTSAVIGDGPDQVGGLPGRTLPGNTGTFTMTADNTVVRLISMISRQNEPDNYVLGVADLTHGDRVTVPMQRFDLGKNEGAERHSYVNSGDVVVTFRRMAEGS